MTPWEIEGRELINCNCIYACPCQFDALPTQGFCEAIGAMSIDKGHYGDVRLDNTRISMALQWPGAIHEGKGKCQPIVDASASPEQREALLKIMSGQDTDPFATVFAVFATTFETVFEPLFAPISFTMDIEKRRATIRVGDIIEMEAAPIRNPVTGDEHRVRIDLPHGFEYEIAEIGSGTAHSRGRVSIPVKDTSAQLATIHLNNHGVIRHRTAA